jgi:sulfite exporter TauE/SafE
MCGGIAAALERPAVVIAPLNSKSELFFLQLMMHLGRLTTYVLLGALAGWLGAALWQQSLVPLQRPLFALTSCLLVWMGLKLLGRGSEQRSLSGKWFGAKIATYWARFFGQMGSRPARWFSGMLWGLVPCALVYSVLPLAFLSGDVWTGAVLMLAFGLGTLPNLLLISRFSAALTQFGHYAWVRYLSAALFFGAGVFGLYRAWVLPEALLKGGFCFT